MDEKRVAALAAVMYYLQREVDEREEESLRMGMRSLSGWSAYGRKAVARNRNMVQVRRIRRPFAGRKTSSKSLKQSKRKHFRFWMKQHELF